MKDDNAAPPGAFADADALDLLDAEAAAEALDAAAAAAPAAPPKLTADNFRLEAAMLISFGADLIGAKVGVTYDAATKQQGAERLAPLLAKYGGVMPFWMQAYKEEFQFGMWCAGVAFQTWLQVQAGAASSAQKTADAQA